MSSQKKVIVYDFHENVLQVKLSQFPLKVRLWSSKFDLMVKLLSFSLRGKNVAFGFS